MTAKEADALLRQARTLPAAERAVLAFGERRRPVPREHREQEQVFVWARGVAALTSDSPLRWLFSTQNGVRLGMLQAVRAKRAGNVSGVPDLVLPQRNRWGYPACWIELKAPPVWDARGKQVAAPGTLSVAQRAWLVALNEAGHYAAVAYGADATIACLRWYVGERKECVLAELGIVNEIGDQWPSWRPVRAKVRAA